MRAAAIGLGLLVTAMPLAPSFAAGAVVQSEAIGEPDTTFLADAIQSGLAEVELGQIAAEKATNPAVKAFGQLMVNDHSAVNKNLMAIAEEQQIRPEGTKGTPPLEPSEEAASMIEELTQLSGAAFDRAYIRHMVEDHEKDFALYEEQASSGEYFPLKELASQTLPVLQEHLQQARSLAQQVQASR